MAASIIHRNVKRIMNDSISWMTCDEKKNMLEFKSHIHFSKLSFEYTPDDHQMRSQFCESELCPYFLLRRHLVLFATKRHSSVASNLDNPARSFRSSMDKKTKTLTNDQLAIVPLRQQHASQYIIDHKACLHNFHISNLTG